MSPDVRQLLRMDGRVPAESLLADGSFHQRGRCVGEGRRGVCRRAAARHRARSDARVASSSLCVWRLDPGRRMATGRVWSSSGQRRLISINCPISSSFVGSVNGPRAGMDPTQSRHRSCPIILQAPSVNLQRFCRMKSGQRCQAPCSPRRHTAQLAQTGPVRAAHRGRSASFPQEPGLGKINPSHMRGLRPLSLISKHSYG